MDFADIVTALISSFIAGFTGGAALGYFARIFDYF
jgi:hypothetical protein